MKIFNVLLQLLDDGRLTDGQGRTVDFRNTVIIMTSNLGNELWFKNSEEVSRDQLSEILQAHFRPEFLNRIDEIIIFHPLRKEHLAQIVHIQLKRLSTLLAKQGFLLELTPEAVEFIAQVGYDPNFGARPLKRAIQRELQDPLALKVLSGEFHAGDTIRVEKSEQGLDFFPVVEAEVVEK